MTTEQLVADAILQNSKKVKIGDKEFSITPPTPATLIMISAEVSNLPTLSADNIVGEVLAKAKDAKSLGRIVAISILGAKRIKENRKIRTHWWKKQSEVNWLTDYILDNLTIAEVAKIVGQRLSQMQIGDFFGLTISLNAVNVTKPTKEVVTQFGE